MQSMLVLEATSEIPYFSGSETHIYFLSRTLLEIIFPSSPPFKS